jgi:integrase/recombinase XerD
MFNPGSVRFRGPLKPYVNGLWSELIRYGYSPDYAHVLLLTAAHLSRWLEQRGIKPSELTDRNVERFAAHRRRQGYVHFLSARSMLRLLSYFREIGVVPMPQAPRVIETRVAHFLREYSAYLVRERGLVSSTIRHYTDFARRFITERPHRLNWTRLTADQITRFILREFEQRSPSYCQHTVGELRSLLRFLHVRGEIENQLATCVPAVAGWRLASLPQALAPEQVDRLLRVCQPNSAKGRRDAAIVRLLVRLGLRACEVAALSLDDIDWRAGEIVVHGKGHRDSRLPMPRDVGRVLAAYLRHGRPSSNNRQVFLRDRALFLPLSTSGVLSATRCALQRAGVMSGGAHLLRHTAATQMLRRGASLDEIAQVLRHRHVDTTAIYAKVDHTALRSLARHWPGGAT